MNRYSELMKSQDGSALLRKLLEEAVTNGQHAGYPLQERLYEDFALVAYPPRDGWALGVRVEYTPDSWSIAEVAALPVGSTRTLPAVDTKSVQADAERAVLKAREGRRVAAEQLVKLEGNAAFVQERFEAWRDKTSRKTNVEYAALAAKYAEQIRQGNPRATATLAELVDMSPSVMAQRIKEARRRALLTPGKQGTASGALTPLAVLYADPTFPGIFRLRQAGMTQGEIAKKYGIEERLVWAGSMGENFSDDNGPLPAIPFPNGGVGLTPEDVTRIILEDFRRRDDRGR